jgi:hypothetical protein
LKFDGFSDVHIALRNKIKDWLPGNHDN